MSLLCKECGERLSCTDTRMGPRGMYCRRLYKCPKCSAKYSTREVFSNWQIHYQPAIKQLEDKFQAALSELKTILGKME